MGSGQITLPLNDPHLWALIDTDGNVIDGREIQVWLDTDYLQTIIPAPKSSPSLMTIDGSDPTYHLRRRFVGRLSSSPNVVLNPNFATDLTSWTAAAGTTQTWVSTPAHQGTGAVELVSAVRGRPLHLAEHHDHVDTVRPVAWITGWLYIGPGVDPQDLVQGRSLFTVWSIGATEVWRQGVHRIGGSSATGSGSNSRCTYRPAIRTRSNSGSTRHSGPSITTTSRSGSTSGSTSPAIPRRSCADSSRDAEQTSIGKVSANIACTVVGSGTAAVTRAYEIFGAGQHPVRDRRNANLQGGVDRVLETDGVNREIVTYQRTGFVPPAGVQTLKWEVGGGDDVNIADWTWAWNPDLRADKVIVGGRGIRRRFYRGLLRRPIVQSRMGRFRPATIEGSVDPNQVAAGFGEVYERPETCPRDGPPDYQF